MYHLELAVRDTRVRAKGETVGLPEGEQKEINEPKQWTSGKMRSHFARNPKER